MQTLPRWRNVLIFNNSLIQSTSTIATSTASSSSSHLASFHSTPTSYEKSKNKWNSDVRKGQQPSKNHIRFTTRQKRADAKIALKDLLFNCGSSKITFEDEFRKIEGTSGWDAEGTDHSDSSNKKGNPKSFARRASKARHNRIRRKLKRECSFEDYDEYPEKIFHATFGQRSYTWSFKSQEESYFQGNRTAARSAEWDTASETESDDESCFVGLSSYRTILGLPPNGPLKIEDIKNAFRLSALKWHPDKHQGPSQEMAEEKFKNCVDAYKSLCNALSTA